MYKNKQKTECDELGGKSDAHKGIRFQTLPNILSLQLRRFEMDWVRMCQIKLSDAVTIPLTLDLKEYMNQHSGSSEETKEQEWVYDLYAVLVHSGSAMGGHYFSYMRKVDGGGGDGDEQKRKWYNFNDATVTELAPKTLERVLGGGDGKKNKDTKDEKDAVSLTIDSSKASETKTSKVKIVTAAKGLKLVKSSSNAYMLMYHRRSAAPAVAPSTTSSTATASLPDDMVAKIVKDNIEYNLNKKEFDEKRNTYQLRIFQKHIETTTTTAADHTTTATSATSATSAIATTKPGYTTVPINCNQTIRQLKQSIIDILNNEPYTTRLYTTSNIRLRDYDTIKNLVTTVYEEEKTLVQLKLSKSHPIMVEYNASGTFLPRDPENTLSLCVIAENNGSMLPAVQIDVQKKSSLATLYTQVLSATRSSWNTVQQLRIILPFTPVLGNQATTQKDDKAQKHRGSALTVPYVLPRNSGTDTTTTMEDLYLVHGMEIYVEEETVEDNEPGKETVDDRAATSTSHVHPSIVDESNSSILFQLGTLRATITIQFNRLVLTTDSTTNTEETPTLFPSHPNPTTTNSTNTTNTTNTNDNGLFNNAASVETKSFLKSMQSNFQSCSLHSTCNSCLHDVACGWCTASQHFGNVCTEGVQEGPIFQPCPFNR